MRSLFAKIFLSFFLTVVLVGALIIVTTMERSDEVSDSMRAIIAQQGARLAALYETSGPSALGEALRGLPVTAVLTDERGRALAEVRDVDRPLVAIAVRLSESGEGGSELHTFRGMGVQLVTSTKNERHYLFALMLPHEGVMAVLRTLDQHPVARVVMIAGVAAVICFLLARHITKPLVRLREAAARVADGHLDARVGSTLIRRHDEIGALGRDFDQMAERLSALVASERMLLADVSHELRSPLARLTVALGLVRRRAGADLTPELDRIERETQRLDTLLGQALTLSRIESGVDAGPRATFDLATLLQEVAADGDFEARASGRRVVLEGDGPFAIVGVVELIRSAIENVVRNAIRHTAAGSAVEMTVHQATRESAPMVVIRVRDHGPGLPDALLADVFLPFRRAESATARNADGAGLGLAIADRAVRMHGGAITAANVADGGLVVEVALPISVTLPS